jgi:hypothetical protein
MPVAGGRWVELSSGKACLRAALTDKLEGQVTLPSLASMFY